MDATLPRRVEQQRVASLYAGTGAVTGAAVLMAAVVIMIAWPQTSGDRLLGWAVAVLLVQAGIQWLSLRYRRAAGSEAEPGRWATRLALLSAVDGLVWGCTAFVLVDAGQPAALALLAACLAGRAIISIMTHAYSPAVFSAFAVPVFGLLAAHYLLTGGYGNTTLGLLWIIVLGYVLLFVDRQSRTLTTQIRLYCENEQLVDQLKHQNLIAEQARLRAEEASRSKSRFFAAANHDLRQPLHSLGLFATALRNGQVDEAGRKLIDQILSCTESLEQLFDNLLDISRLDAGQVDVKRENVPVNVVFERLRGTFSVPAQEKGLKLHIRRSKALLNTDATLLLRLLSNLVANAIRYTEQGSILVACRKHGARARIEVWDSGIGIQAEQHERVFEEFYQLNNPERDRSRGLGLGLATVKRIATLLDHPLRLRSAPGRGSRFTLEVPLTDPDQLQSITATVEQKVPNLLRGKLIAVIDDEASVRLGMQSLLDSWGCKCVTAMDAAELQRSLAGRVPDFIIADLRLRGSATGIEAIGTLRAALGDAIPAVLISGDTATEQLRKVSAAGLTLMHKPLKPIRLRALLNHEFARRANQRAVVGG